MTGIFSELRSSSMVLALSDQVTEVLRHNVGAVCGAWAMFCRPKPLWRRILTVSRTVIP